MGRRRAHRLRAAYHPAAGRHRWAAGEIAFTLDRCAADSGLVRVQHRRHARAPDAGLYRSTPHRVAQHVAARPAVVPVLLRSRLRRPDAAGRGVGEPRRHRRFRGAMGPCERAWLFGHVRAVICSIRCRRYFRSCGMRSLRQRGQRAKGKPQGEVKSLRSERLRSRMSSLGSNLSRELLRESEARAESRDGWP